MRLNMWKTDWFAGVIIVTGFTLLASSTSLVSLFENKAYDTAMRWTTRSASNEVVIVAIDDESIDKIGRWPWSRNVQAKLIDAIHAGKPKVIVNSIYMDTPQQDPSLVYMQQMRQIIDSNRQAAEKPPVIKIEKTDTLEKQFITKEVTPVWVAEIEKTLSQAEQDLSADKHLSDSFSKAGNIIAPISFSLGEPEGNPEQALDASFNPSIIKQVNTSENSTLTPAHAMLANLPVFNQQSARLGGLTTAPDNDSIVRKEILAYDYFGQVFTSVAIQAVAENLNVKNDAIQVNAGSHVQVGGIKIPMSEDGTMRPFFYPLNQDRAAFTHDSAYDLLSGKINPSKYQGKIVVLGVTATALGSQLSTPVSNTVSPAEYLSSIISSILKQDFVRTPSSMLDNLYALLSVLAVASYLIFALPRLKAAHAAAISLGFFSIMVGTTFILFVTQLYWLPFIYSASLLVIGHLLLTTKRFLMTEKGKEKADASSAESNRMLGLAFQGQGQLDMAFDKFRHCPMDDGVMDLLYNLALDFERKRQFNKAEAVYQHMLQYNPKYRDLKQKLDRSRAMAETVMFGSTAHSASGSILNNGSVEKPMLGRYQVEKELGKGAMGVVYQGKDPKIGRIVAIKTMALAEEFSGGELEEARTRFFREAETAGRLNHPNIVTIYDAGEEHDLAYIAMEFLRGNDLAGYIKPGVLLPIDEVLRIGEQIASALHYAHQQSVVHRDIKPANIMYEASSKTVKVTDFGIARITDSSRTKTGMVLGTPSYMSPEQLSGKRVDGRSDLFSLCVMMYQMISGQLPFQGESMAELMYCIANAQHMNIKEHMPHLPDLLAETLDRGLAKQADQRFQTGAELAAAIAKCRVAVQAI